MNAPEKIRLTEFSHGGGCGCKIAPAVLSEILASSQIKGVFPKDLLVGTETADDAAVYRLNDTQALVATTDFFTPIVDDPHDFGRIAATNAISDVYAMGGRPIMALALVGMPLEKLPVSVIRKVLEGGESVCAAAGIPIAGGHSIDTLEPIYGLVALGLVHPDKVKRNSSGRAGDVLILGKPLGIGILSAALKKGKLSAAGYAQMLDWTTRLNTPGVALGDMPAVHALTDVTGFSLMGHAREMANLSGLTLYFDVDALPLLPGAESYAKAGLTTGGGKRNESYYGSFVSAGRTIERWMMDLLYDPQTSGPLLAAVDPSQAAKVIAAFQSAGEPLWVVGEAKTGPGGTIELG